jgi:hypothetical protein
MEITTARRMQRCLDKVRKEWGTGWHLLGSRIQQALLAEALLVEITQQDEDVDPARIVRMLNLGWDWINLEGLS